MHLFVCVYSKICTLHASNGYTVHNQQFTYHCTYKEQHIQWHVNCWLWTLYRSIHVEYKFWNKHIWKGTPCWTLYTIMYRYNTHIWGFESNRLSGIGLMDCDIVQIGVWSVRLAATYFLYYNLILSAILVNITSDYLWIVVCRSQNQTLSPAISSGVTDVSWFTSSPS